ncbi:hypothetical protein A3715_18330 [Oleiphilus sp. HI0009]|nr:hypothetical protein A3715_18330 [Oleiphilus sp. HI0009]
MGKNISLGSKISRVAQVNAKGQRKADETTNNGANIKSKKSKLKPVGVMFTPKDCLEISLRTEITESQLEYLKLNPVQIIINDVRDDMPDFMRVSVKAPPFVKCKGHFFQYDWDDDHQPKDSIRQSIEVSESSVNLSLFADKDVNDVIRSTGQGMLLHVDDIANVGCVYLKLQIAKPNSAKIKYANTGGWIIERTEMFSMSGLNYNLVPSSVMSSIFGASSSIVALTNDIISAEKKETIEKINELDKGSISYDIDLNTLNTSLYWLNLLEILPKGNTSNKIQKESFNLKNRMLDRDDIELLKFVDENDMSLIEFNEENSFFEFIKEDKSSAILKNSSGEEVALYETDSEELLKELIVDQYKLAKSENWILSKYAVFINEIEKIAKTHISETMFISETDSKYIGYPEVNLVDGKITNKRASFDDEEKDEILRECVELFSAQQIVISKICKEYKKKCSAETLDAIRSGNGTNRSGEDIWKETIDSLVNLEIDTSGTMMLDTNDFNRISFLVEVTGAQSLRKK